MLYYIGLPSPSEPMHIDRYLFTTMCYYVRYKEKIFIG